MCCLRGRTSLCPQSGASADFEFRKVSCCTMRTCPSATEHGSAPSRSLLRREHSPTPRQITSPLNSSPPQSARRSRAGWSAERRPPRLKGPAGSMHEATDVRDTGGGLHFGPCTPAGISGVARPEDGDTRPEDFGGRLTAGRLLRTHLVEIDGASVAVALLDHFPGLCRRGPSCATLR